MHSVSIKCAFHIDVEEKNKTYVSEVLSVHRQEINPSWRNTFHRFIGIQNFGVRCKMSLEIARDVNSAILNSPFICILFSLNDMLPSKKR